MSHYDELHRCECCRKAENETIMYKDSGEYFCEECALRESNKYFHSLSEEEKAELFCKAFGDCESQEDMPDWWEQLDAEDKIELAGYEAA